MVFQPLFGQIVGQSTDSNYFNTTVVYVQDNTKGADALSQVDSDFGLGDMVRIEVAPPPPVNQVVRVKTTIPNALINNPPIQTMIQPKPVANAVKAAPTVQKVEPSPSTSKISIPEPRKKINVGAKTTKKVVKRQKCKYRPPFMATVKRKKHGKQRIQK